MKNLILLLALVACSHQPKKNQPTPSVKKKNLVLIQGYHLDDTSWDEIRVKLPSEQFDIKTHKRIGRDLTRPASLTDIASLICKDIPKHSILVGHSYGGAIATAMYGLCPEKIKKIIYISAVIPNNGELPFARVRDKTDQTHYAKAVIIDGKMIRPKDPKIFYPAMDPTIDVKKHSIKKTYSESMSLTTEVVNYDSEQFKKLPKAYIKTSEDLVVGIKTQEMFIDSAGIRQTASIPTGHFPMIAKPEMLAEKIIELTQ